jgi:hypothetical protein
MDKVQQAQKASRERSERIASLKESTKDHLHKVIIGRWIEEVLTIFGVTAPDSDPDVKTVSLKDRGLVRSDYEDFDEYNKLLEAFKEVMSEQEARKLAVVGVRAICSIVPSELMEPCPRKADLTVRDKETVAKANRFGIAFDFEKGYEVENEDKARVSRNFDRPSVYQVRRILGARERSPDKYLSMIIERGDEVIEQIRQGRGQ